MPFADTARSQLYYLEEVTWGTTPAAALKAMRFTGETLNFSIDTKQSNEIRSDRQITDLIRTDAQPGGNINFEVSYGAPDDLLAGAFYNAWLTATNMTGSTFAAVSGSPDSFTDSANGFITGNIKAGQWIRTSGFTNPANNGFFQVLTVAAGTITVKGETALVNESAAAGRTIKGQTLRNGVTAKSFSMEVAFADVTKFKAFTGMRVNTMALNLTAGEIMTGVLNMLGKGSALNAVTISTGGPVAAPTADVLNAVNNVAYISEGGALFAGKLKEFSVNLDNKLRQQKAVSVLGNAGIGAGRATVTGKLSAYFEGLASDLYSKYIVGTETSLSFRFTDAANNNYILTLPRVKLTKGELTAGAADQDVMADIEFQALRHPTYDFTIQLDRIA
jgi:hypothetical protein